MIDCSDLKELVRDASQYLKIPEKDLTALIIQGSIRAARSAYPHLKDNDILPRFHKESWKLELKVDTAKFGLDASELETKVSSSVKAAIALIFRELQDEVKSVSRQEAEEWLSNINGQCITATVAEKRGSEIVLKYSDIELAMPVTEQIPGEQYAIGQELVVFVKSLVELKHRNEVVVSRLNKELVAWAIKKWIPEIDGGLVNLRAVALYGIHGAVAALSSERLDALDRAERKKSCVEKELSQLRIRFIEWFADPKAYIASILAFPIKEIKLNEKKKQAMVYVGEDLLDQNKLNEVMSVAQELAGYKISLLAAGRTSLPKIGLSSD